MKDTTLTFEMPLRLLDLTKYGAWGAQSSNTRAFSILQTYLTSPQRLAALHEFHDYLQYEIF